MKHLNKFLEKNYSPGNGKVTDDDVEYLTQCFIDFIDTDPRTKSNKFTHNGYPSWSIKIYTPERKTGNVYHRGIELIEFTQKEIEKELDFYEDIKTSIEKGLSGLKNNVRVEIDSSLMRDGYMLCISFIPYLLNTN